MGGSHTVRGEAGDDDLRQQIGPALRQLRQRRNWSLQELADRSGISRSHLSRLERGACSPSFLLLARVALVLGVAPNYFDGFDRASREYDRDLRTYLAEVGIPQATWEEFTALGLEARGALRDALRRLTEPRAHAVTQQRALEQLILDRGVADTVPEILAGIEEYGLSPLDFGRGRAQIEEFPGDRQVIGNRLATVPGSNRFDQLQIFRVLFGVEVPDPNLLRVWNSTISSSLEQTLASHGSRTILPIDAMERYITRGYWVSRLPFGPDVVREHVEATIALLRGNDRYQIGLVRCAPPIGFILKGEGGGMAFSMTEVNPEFVETRGVALRFYGSAVTNRFREYFETLWSAIPAQLREPAAVANWFEARLHGTAATCNETAAPRAAPASEPEPD
ncbi:MAG TPA: helix-turn-helix transcriptional regulator [Thermomicrobiaceae bacterium]|nr:helix-turn-helix transcriptional regulator [Thermomicrobiaceae bacterium]